MQDVCAYLQLAADSEFWNSGGGRVGSGGIKGRPIEDRGAVA